MPNYEDFRAWLREELDQRGLSHADLARRSKLTRSHISRILSGERVPGTKSLVAIAMGLRLPAEEVLRRAGLAPTPRGMVEGQEELLSFFAAMTPANRKRLIGVARLLADEHIEE